MKTFTLAAACLLLLGVSATAQVVTSQEYVEGLADGRIAGAKHPSFFLAGWGVVFGGFAVLNAWMAEVKVPEELLLQIQDRPEQYQLGFVAGFKEAAKNQKILYGVAGWSTWILFALLAR